MRWRPSISSPDTARGSWASGIADDRFREGGREAFSTNLCLWEVRFSGIRNCDALCGFENFFCILAVASVGFENAADFVAAVVQKPHLQMPAPISAQMTATPTTSMPIRCAGLSIHPAEAGTRVKREVHNARGTGTFEAYELECKVYARLNFTSTSGVRTASSGGSDCTTAACFMLGETSDSLLSPRADRVSPCDSREEKFKAVDRVPRN